MNTWELDVPRVDGFFPANPSIARGPEGLAIIATYRNLKRGDTGLVYEFDESGVIKTRNFFAELDSNLNLVTETWRELPSPEVELLWPFVQGIEDPRLYWEGEWKYVGSIFQHHASGEPRCARCTITAGLGDILPAEDGVWVKNLMPTGATPELLDAYPYGLHGGAVCSWDGGWLGVVHDTVWPARRYFHHFCWFDAAGRMERLGPRFRFGERDIEFAAGIAVHGDRVVVSYGVQDKAACLSSFSIPEVLSLLS